ncbi:low temperature requirement protein A [Micromonospora sp. WMMD812]|uniref:low temperature requirement protein A n=1 Tax=Micromonospora sp. WMMD812 TaxID=3015152 RepID=UPI00248D1585|nr:low temperature requirement protein A [Micromonospora sp. WMMD812]WBB68019.1 low temperature requirement protein A [Micromonospora sp. WMMD812]
MAMAAGGDAEAAASLARARGRPAFLELFFDLVYVFALISLVKTQAENLTWTGVVGTLVLLLAFTLVWAITTWAADSLDLSRPLVQVQLIAVAAASLLLAAATPQAYDGRGLLFAVTYLTIHLGSSSYYLLFDRKAPEPRRSGRIFFWYTIVAVAWVGGGLAGGPVRLALWATAVTVEYTAASLGWPVPRFGRSQPQEWRLVGERVAERYRQFVIIALGAALFVLGTRFSLNDGASHVVALVVMFTGVVLMWRIYIYRAGELLTEAIARATNPSLLTQFAAVTHLIMVAGIAGMAVTSHLVVVRPFGPTPPSWAAVILGGPALFLIGRGVLDYTVFARISRSRLVGLALLAAVAPVATRLPPVGVALLAVIVLLLIAAANLVSTRRHARTPRPPARR